MMPTASARGGMGLGCRHRLQARSAPTTGQASSSKPITRQNGSGSLRRRGVSKATPRQAAASMVTEETLVYTDGRGNSSLTESEIRDFGFTKVGKPVPHGIPMSDVLDSIPKVAFEKDNREAYKSLALTLVACTASQVLIAMVPNWLLPVAWAVAGTAFTGFFVLAHDCGHRSFHTSKTVEDVIGTLLMAPLIYPFEAWRFKHAQHHAKTNMLVEDTAWHPVVVEEMEEMPAFIRVATKTILGTPIKFLASILHWVKWHFDLSLYKKTEKPKVATSIAACAIFAAVCWPLLVAHTGWFGFLKHYVVPWLGFHFWLSMFTLVHHTSPHIPFKAKDVWDPVQAQLGGTVHCTYPKWIEVLCFDINVHVPHHLSPRIPHYRLRLAYDAIKAKYGEYCNEAKWGVKLMSMLVRQPHIYDEETNYVSFREHDARSA